MKAMRKFVTAIRAATAALPALALAACAIPDVSQVSLPRVEFKSFIPTDQTQYVNRSKDSAVRPDEFVDASGRCPGAPAAEASAGSEQAAPPAPAAPPAIRGVGLEMTECEVVRAAGQPESIQIGANERGERSVVMIYATPERPTYRFVAGRLVSIERGAEPPPEPSKKKPPPKKQARKPQAT